MTGNNKSHAPAQANAAPHNAFPSVVNNNDDNNFQPNQLQQTQMPIQHAQPELSPAGEAEGYVVVPNTVETPNPELKKNGEPKKQRGRKRSECKRNGPLTICL